MFGNFSPFGSPAVEVLEAEKLRTVAQLMRYLATGYADPNTNEATAQKARANEPLKECA